jgi:hypothetical protein
MGGTGYPICPLLVRGQPRRSLQVIAERSTGPWRKKKKEPNRKDRTMRIGSRVARAAAFVALIAMVATASAQMATKPLKDRLLGAWHLVSVTVGEAQPYGDNPRGLMYVGADGYFSVVAIGEGTTQKIAYFGTYTVDDPGSSITFHVTATTSGNGGGRDHKWLIALDGNEVHLNLASPTGGRGPVTTIWKHEG